MRLSIFFRARSIFLPSKASIRKLTKSKPAPPDAKAPFAGLVFKLMADKHLGQLAFVRIYSGTVTSGSYVYNTIKRY